MSQFVYIIYGSNSFKNKFYIGYTNNLYRRIRQHNGIIKGGAKATRGYKWSYCGIITNFRDNIEGLRIEWRLKHCSKSHNIDNKICSFFDYININNKSSPKSDILKQKLFFYYDDNIIKNIKEINKCINIKTKFYDIIIDHLMSKE